ncbi:S-adenosyl-L-methionine-dependent methyltransferase [Hypoxylon trugodes]|uniref:S-adenosyl-L-methionine-dependent methyltransferase n=1 Tax=Hypoxylon trugodes TaxID=326681 RepID=UPI0021972CF6|nr:S-adenosyl-L-methionine-dependent methyltransferase [Hypoxylon trugodes]KAI1387897.1 S-adenosyl-L-methionine-dependent methyltransferase [Hypoxylon trugodes]
MMQPMCAHAVATRAAIRRCRRGGNGLRWVAQDCRRYATKQSQPPKPSRAVPKPLPFQPTKPTTPKPKATPSSSSSSSKGHEDKAQPLSELLPHRWFPLLGIGLAAGCVGYFMISAIHYWRTQPPENWTPGEEPETPTGRSSIQSPREFDQHLDKSEWRFGVTKVRRRIASEMARGHVLEVAVGTGRNFDYYNWDILTAGLEPAKEEKKSWFSWSSKDAEKEKGDEKKTVEKEKGEAKVNTKEEKGPATTPRQLSPQLEAAARAKYQNAVLSFTGIDVSPSVLDLALTRIRQVVPHMTDQIPKKPTFTQLADSEDSVSLANNRIRIIKADAQSPIPPPPPFAPQKYDTILQTFGLCSVRDPVLLLSNLAASVKPDTGRIILFEHGRTSWWEFINGMLDRSARKHFERFGCWWNRDMELIVRAAERAVPGLEVVSFERPGFQTFGTHVLVEMRVRGDVAAKDNSKAREDSEEGQNSASWWSSWLSVSKKNDEPKNDEK